MKQPHNYLCDVAELWNADGRILILVRLNGPKIEGGKEIPTSPRSTSFMNFKGLMYGLPC